MRDQVLEKVETAVTLRGCEYAFLYLSISRFKKVLRLMNIADTTTFSLPS